jgi:hypothetical protein
VLILLLLDIRLCNAQRFCDAFDRPDSTDIGNGWVNTLGNSGGDLVLASGAVTTTATVGAGGAGIYRPFPLASVITLYATVSEMNGNFSLRRYDNMFSVLNDGTLFGGYGIEIVRGDQNTNDSRINLVDNGTTIATVSSSFQYGPQINLFLRFVLDGRVSGTISNATDSFNFSFGPRTVQSVGDNFSWGTTFPDPRDSSYTFPTLDNICILPCSAKQLTPLSLPAGTVGVPYSQTISVVDNSGPYTLTVASGTLPPGLSMSGSGLISSLLSGTPTTGGTYAFTVMADSRECTSSQSYALTIECFSPLGPDGLPALKWPLDGTPLDYNVAGNRWDYQWIRSCGSVPKRHNGLDLTLRSGATMVGKPVYAAYPGVIIQVYNPCGTKGCAKGVDWQSGITVLHTDNQGNNFTTSYIHVVPLNGKNAPKVGKTVSKGAQIATVGAIMGGGVTGPHLHFSIRRAPYANTANRGALPDLGADQGDCLCTDDQNNADPLFPEFFIDPSLATYE